MTGAWLAAFGRQAEDIAVTGCSFLGYFVTGRIPGLAAHPVPTLAIDRAIPLLPRSAYAYLSLYPMLAFNLIYLVPRPRALRPLLGAITLANALGSAIFALYRTSAARPALPPGRDTHAWLPGGPRLLAWIWRADPPHNAVPSLHTTYAILLAWAHLKWRSPYRALIAPWAALVVASTLTTKQHQALDVAGGALLAALSERALLRRLAPADLGPPAAGDPLRGAANSMV